VGLVDGNHMVQMEEGKLIARELRDDISQKVALLSIELQQV
jgi:nitrate/nitrite-specific signal transduction histidine kinase